MNALEPVSCGHLHGFIGRVLFCEVNEFDVESFLLLILHWHCFLSIPGWDVFLDSKKPIAYVNHDRVMFRK